MHVQRPILPDQKIVRYEFVIVLAGFRVTNLAAGET